jgi:UDP-sugar transporter A1/2/3
LAEQNLLTGLVKHFALTVVMFGGNVKTMVLLILVLQNSTLVLIMRASRLVEGPMYLASTVVFLGELFKLVASLGLLFKEVNYNWKQFTSLINGQIHSHVDNLKICVPAVLYLIQNNLVFVAISNMDSATYQVLYQLKIFTTAVMSVLLLNKKLTLQHWGSLVLLFCGVVLVQQSTSSTTKTVASQSDSRRPDQNPFLGFIAILVAVCCSGELF